MRAVSIFFATTLAVFFCVQALGQGDDKKKDDKKDEKDASPALPLNPFEKAAEGDWTLLRRTSESNGNQDVDTLHLEVTKVQGDEVTVTSRGLEPPPEVEGVKAEAHASTRTFSKKKAPTLAQYLDGLKGSGPKWADEKKTAGDKTLECKKLTITIDDEHEGKAEMTLWLSADVPVGIVAMKLKGGEATVDTVLLGYGTKGKTTFGKSAADVEAELKKAAKGEDPKPAKKDK